MKDVSVVYFLFELAVCASFMLVAFFSLQVYTVTKFPFKAPHFWTRKTVLLCCVGIWLLAGLLNLRTIFYNLYLDFDTDYIWWKISTVFWCIVVIIQIVLKILTCWEVFKTRRNSRQSRSSKYRQITTTVMIMVVIQMFTALPFIVIQQLWHVFSLNSDLLKEITLYQLPVAWLNFCVNPVIYFLRLPHYRSSLFSLCGCRKRKNQTSSDPQRNEQKRTSTSPRPSYNASTSFLKYLQRSMAWSSK